MIDQLVGLSVTMIMLLTGLYGLLRPEVLARYDEDATPNQARLRRARAAAALLFCLTAIGLYAILTHDGKPVDPPLILILPA